MLFKGSGVKPFDLEFRRLYATSLPIHGLPEEEISSCLPFHLNTVDSPTQSITSSSTSASDEQQQPADPCAAVPKQEGTIVLEHQQPASVGFLLTTSKYTMEPTPKTGTNAQVKGLFHHQTANPIGRLNPSPQFPALKTGRYSPPKAQDTERTLSPLISPAPQPSLQKGTFSTVKAQPVMPTVGQTAPGCPVKSPTVLPPRLQLLLAQRHSSFSRECSVSALPWRNTSTTGSNNSLPNAVDRGQTGGQRKFDLCKKQCPAVTTAFRA